MTLQCGIEGIPECDRIVPPVAQMHTCIVLLSFRKRPHFTFVFPQQNTRTNCSGCYYLCEGAHVWIVSRSGGHMLPV